ncbi:sporulation membrane protein YtrI [Halobacillus ihumii]|uniref:sporulation membrane protein YtrI n=1 Tax=Halobacillus ihumii TaxID=2686092 RepID=UPI0013D78638|nr:sporulation membrane protein YtrI [Halobacillus ihumii]
MYIPPQVRSTEWRRFYAGMVFGIIIGYLLFVFINGQLQEQLVEENIELSTKLKDAEAKYENLLNAEEEEEEEHKEGLTVQEITVEFQNAKDLEVDKLTQHQLSSMVKDQLTSVTGSKIEEISRQREIIISAIENKQFKVDDFIYHLTVEQLVIANELLISLSIEIDH